LSSWLSVISWYFFASSIRCRCPRMPMYLFLKYRIFRLVRRIFTAEKRPQKLPDLLTQPGISA
jgi:hypothetical protein